MNNTNNNMTLDAILSNIYGPQAGNSFENIHTNQTGGRAMRGGCGCDRDDGLSNSTGQHERYIDEIMGFKRLKAVVNKGRCRIVDEVSVQMDVPNLDYRRSPPVVVSEQLSGGSKKAGRVLKQREDVENPLYIDNEDVMTFFKEFFFLHRASDPHSNSVYIIPSSSTLKKMVKDFQETLREELKKKNDKSGIKSSTAAKIASSLLAPYKEYIFDIYPKDLTDNKKYVIPPEWPETPVEGVFQRMNRLKHIYYISISGKSISIGQTESEAKSGKHKLSFIARTNVRNCFVLQGDIPMTVSAHDKGMVTFTGGSKRKGAVQRDALKTVYLNLVKKFKDVNVASYNFIGTIGPALGVQKVMPYYSADFNHCAMQILADRKTAFKDLKMSFSPTKKSINTFHKQLLNHYNPSNKGIKESEARKSFAGMYHGVGTKQYIEEVKRAYQSKKLPLSMLKADIASNMLGNCPFGDVKRVNEAIDSMDSFDTSDFGMQFNGQGRYAFGEVVHNTLSRNPFHGFKSRQYVPIIENSYEDKYCDQDEDDEILPGDEDEKPKRRVDEDEGSEGEDVDVSEDDEDRESSQKRRPQEPKEPSDAEFF
jgi:hypothetical protein